MGHAFLNQDTQNHSSCTVLFSSSSQSLYFLLRDDTQWPLNLQKSLSTILSIRHLICLDHLSWDVMALPPQVILAVIKINPSGAGKKKIQLPVFMILPYITSNRKGFLGRVWHLLRHFPVLINPCFIDR